MDLIWPPDIIPNDVEWRLIDSTGVFTSPLSGATRTVSRPGTNRWGVRFTFRNLKEAQRYRVMAHVAALRGQSNRIWLQDISSKRRGTFPAAEVLPNNTFSNGATGWGNSGAHSQSATDRVMRVTRTSMAGTGYVESPATAALTQYAPYVARALVQPGRGTFSSLGVDFTAGTNATFDANYGMKQHVVTTLATTAGMLRLSDQQTSGQTPGDYYSVPYTSVSQCALVDNAPNYFLQSDEFDATWTTTRSSVNDQAIQSPDGTVNADELIEDSSNNTHFVAQNITIPSTANVGYAFSVAIKAGTRTWAALQMEETGGTTNAIAYINLSTGAVGTVNAAGNWTNARAFASSLGASWWHFTLVARKTNSATGLVCRIYTASADNTVSYAGDGASKINIWRATAAQSGVPTRLSQTTAAATSGAAQPGSGVYVKGLPASVSGLLEMGDMVQIAGELKRATARLNSDASGLGYLQFEPALRSSPADGAPIIFHEPMGKFLLNTNEAVWDTRPGLRSDFSLDFVEAVGN